jgi:hypothetical protein
MKQIVSLLFGFAVVTGACAAQSLPSVDRVLRGLPSGRRHHASIHDQATARRARDRSHVLLERSDPTTPSSSPRGSRCPAGSDRSSATAGQSSIA